MPGRPPWSQSGTQGGGQTVAVNERPEVKVQEFDQTTDLAAGASETVEVYPPKGAIWTMNGMRLRAKGIGAATTGNHRFVLRHTTSPPITATYGEASYNNEVMFGNSNWTKASASDPSDAKAQAEAVKAIRATENHPFIFEYQNDTDATQTKKRVYQLSVDEVTL